MIRKAQSADASAVISLVMIVLKDMELPIFTKWSEEKVQSCLEQLFTDPHYRYSYRRALVYEQEHEIAGVAFSYSSEDEPLIDQAWNQLMEQLGEKDRFLFTEKETLGSEWYLDTLVVGEKFRGQKIGSKLLDAVGEYAAEQGAECLGLNVDQKNSKARKLYESKGFEKAGECVLSGHV